MCDYFYVLNKRRKDVKSKTGCYKKHGCYSASNKDLKIRDQQGRLMKGEHDVFVTSNVAKNGFVIVKTITSLENNKTGGFHNSALADVKKA